MRSAPGRYKGLDGVRGICAYLVVVSHASGIRSNLGEYSVDMFFVLSGYLIAGILYRQRKAIDAGRISFASALRIFWTNRALRIFPAYYTWMLIFVALQRHFGGGGDIYNGILFYISYTQNFMISFYTRGWGTFTHTWSLAVEQQFYVVFGFVLLFFRSRYAPLIVCGSVLLCAAAITAMELLGLSEMTRYTMPPSGFFFILAGALLAVARNVPSLLSSPLTAFIGLLWVIGLSFWPLITGAPPHLSFLAADITASTSLASVLAFILRHQEGVTVRFLDGALFRFLGAISYSVYIIHVPLLYLLTDIPALNIWVRVGIYGVMDNFLSTVLYSTILATLTYYLIERPALRLKRGEGGEVSAQFLAREHAASGQGQIAGSETP